MNRRILAAVAALLGAAACKDPAVQARHNQAVEKAQARAKMEEETFLKTKAGKLWDKHRDVPKHVCIAIAEGKITLRGAETAEQRLMEESATRATLARSVSAADWRMIMSIIDSERAKVNRDTETLAQTKARLAKEAALIAQAEAAIAEFKRQAAR